MTIEQQINTIIQGMQCATTKIIIVNLSGDPRVITSFEAYYNAVASHLELLLSLKNTPTSLENRNINKFASRKCKNSENKGTYLNEGRAKKDPKKDNLSKDFVPEKKVYPPHVCKGLSNVNKEKVRTLYRLNQNNNNPSQRQGSTPVRNQNVIPYLPSC